MSNNSLYLCEPKIQFSSGGQSWENGSPELIKDLLQITVEESLHLPAMFTLVVHNSYLPTSDRAEYQPWYYEKLFEVGKKVKLGFISSTTQDPSFKQEIGDDHLIEGEITAIEVHFNEKSEAPIVIRGYDISHRLHRGRYNRSFLNVTDSDIVRKIASETGIKPGKIDPSGEPHEYVFQENQTNMEFLRQRAARIGFELFVQGDKINFCKPESQESLTLIWLHDISSFSTRITSAEQVNEVEVRYWDYTNKELRTAKAKKEKVITDTGNGAGSSNSTKFNNTPSPIMTVVDKPTFSDKQAEIMAQALCDELGGEFVYADAKAQGNPKIRPGRVVTLEKMGDRFSGKYYITETRHHFSQRTYTTDFSVRGLRGGDLFTTISPQVHLQPGQTFLVGIVTDNKDPKGLGRVKVQFPTLTKEHTSNWARVVAPGAGKNRGFDCLPEVNDEVLVGFEHGDIHRPYVIGGVWNGKDEPPESVNDTIDQEGDVKKVRLRTFKTRTGHTLQFVEKDKGGSKTGIRVETVYGHKIYLNDSEKSIEIKTKDGHSIKMDDIRQSISIDSKGSISINANTTIDIKANGIITINGELIRLN